MTVGFIGLPTHVITIPYTDSSYWEKQFDTLRPRHNGHHFADDTFNRIFVYENVRNSVEFSLKFVPKGPINIIPALVLIMAWRGPSDRPLFEPMLVRSLTHICVTRPQCVNAPGPRRDGQLLDGAKPLSEPVMVRLLTHICVTRPQWDKGGGTNGRTNGILYTHLPQWWRKVDYSGFFVFIHEFTISHYDILYWRWMVNLISTSF